MSQIAGDYHMLTGSKTRGVQDFHVLVLAGPDVIADRIIRCASESDAFKQAGTIVFACAARRPGDLSGYVLDHNQAFLGAVEAASPALASAA